MGSKLSDLNRLSIIRPDIALEWDYERNGDITPDDVAVSSGKKFWWKCSKGHAYKTEVWHRNRGNGCPYCSGQKVCLDNCLVTNYPEIAKQWHPTKNGDLTPYDITPYSNKKFWWLCDKGHSYDMRAGLKTDGAGCPYCNNQRISDTNNLAVNYPEIASQWDYDKNKHTPYDVLPHSGKKVWWICDQGHSYDMTPQKRLKGMGCYYCSGHRVSELNSIRSKTPELVKEFHPIKNGKYTVDNVSFSSGKKIWWICSEGHEWKATPCSRTAKNSSGKCPYCTGKRACKDNCLSVTHPYLADQWNYAKNGDLTPQDVTHGSGKLVWWICEFDHEWKSKINNRSHGRNCPICASSLKTSFPEQSIYFYLDRIIENVESQFKFVNFNIEVDVYIPQLKLAIEYDGVFFHKKKKRIKYDIKKSEILYNNGISLVKIRENGLPELNLEYVTIINRKDTYSYESIDDCIKELLTFIKRNYNINFKHIEINSKEDRFLIYDQMIMIKRKNSLRELNANIAEEWHPYKNSSLKPEHIGVSSNLKVWWKCKNCDNEWEATVSNRNKGYGTCPICRERIKNNEL